MPPAQVEVPPEIFERVNALCPALPEVTVRVDLSQTADEIDRALLRHPKAVVLPARHAGGAAGAPRPLLVLRVDPDEREALLATGHPFAAPRAGGRDRIVVHLDEHTDWGEVRELVRERTTACSRRRSSPT